MSKYIIELDYDLQRVVGVGVKQGTVWVKDYDVDDLEELCADYINEHFCELQDQAYQRGLEEGKQTAVGAAELREKLEYQKGFEDGKAVHEKGCEGCKYAGKVVTGTPCITCCNLYKNQWKAKDDKIEVGDEVKPSYSDIAGVVTLVDGDTIYVLWRDGSSTSIIKLKDLCKTGRHFDIAKILEDMRHD